MSIRYHRQAISYPGKADLQLAISGDSTKPVILVLGGISATCNAITPTGDGWWQGLHAAIPNLDDFCLISCDYLEGLGASKTYHTPITTIEDHAQAIASALIDSGFADLHAIIGGSFGGQVALALATTAQLQINKLVLIAAAHRPHAAAVTLRRFQRDLIQLATQADSVQLGVELARALAMFTYRSSTALDQYHPQPEAAYQYLRSRANHLVTQQPERALSLFEKFGPALDSYVCDPRQINIPSIVIGFHSDQLVPAHLLTELADLLPQCVAHHVFESSYGHDGFIKDTHLYATVVKRFLRDA